MSRSLDFSVRLNQARSQWRKCVVTAFFSQPTFYIWKKKFGAMGEAEVKRLREFEKENGRLKHLSVEKDDGLADRLINGKAKKLRRRWVD